ncbi:aldo/keto reductase [Extibacter muris]|uniref:aldo/keto reductase n=1 Tax=Extibacter muris TaxID=1796622 RepID=UPI001D07B21F|nr:aldo/keto reductase [Extibacter muris]MCB6202348.1 aldo/keto reductase [Extibacter muris]MCQ4665585.1 aldo/keto reductase [Extibacter muris]MCQ4695092.1 aldo/keto reductase [Extibacter muris]
MRYKKLGKSGVDVSVMTIGTWAMGGLGYGSVERKDCIEAVHAMVDNGVNHIDTAWVYGLGESDKVVGEAIKGIRDKVLITTKCGFRNPAEGNGPNFPDCSPEWMTWCFEESLRNLGTDYVDFFLIHVPDANVPFEVTAECVNRWQREGKVRYLGVSNFGIPDMERMGQYLDITAVQSGYSMVVRGEEENMIWAREHGIGVMTHSSLASGLLTGAIRRLPELPDDDIRKLYQYPHFQEPRFSRVMELLKTLDKVAAGRNVPVAQVALNWNTQKDFVTTSLCGVRNVKEAVENCRSTEWELTHDEMQLIDNAIEETVGR